MTTGMDSSGFEKCGSSWPKKLGGRCCVAAGGAGAEPNLNGLNGPALVDVVHMA
jgi:hypothetical protein